MIEIRKETLEDIQAIHNVNEQAFANTEYQSGIEATLSDKLRDKGLVTVSLVAVQDSTVVGHIMFSPITIGDENAKYKAVILSILSVLPSFQRKGIGTKLINAGHDECLSLGYEIVILFGHPWYYPRFGYVPARSKGIESRGNVPDDVFMVAELVAGALDGKSGIIQFHPEHRAIFAGHQVQNSLLNYSQAKTKNKEDK